MSLLVTVILVPVVLNEGWIQSVDAHGVERALRSSNSGNALSTLDEVRGNGSMLLAAALKNNIEQGELLYSSLNFTCNGTIDRLIFLAEQSNLNSFNYLNFGLLHPTHNPLRKMSFSASNATHFEDSRTAYEIMPEAAYFVEGDMFSIHQAGDHYYIFFEKKKVKVCNSRGTMCKEKNGYPLVAIETNPPGCANGFISIAALRYIMRATELTSHSTSLHYPSQIYFGCNNSNITKWTVGAKITGNDKKKAALVHIKEKFINTVNTTHLSSLNTTPYINVYETRPRPPVQVHEDQYIQVNSSRVYYRRCGLSGRCRDQPLVAVSVNCPSNCSNCTHGFMSVEELREKARYIPSFADRHEVNGMYIPFPHLTISQDGYLTKWTFTAEDLGEKMRRTGYPDLLLLTSNSECDDVDCSAVIYYLNGSQSLSTIFPNVYEYRVDPPLPVKAGYFIAIHQPPKKDARMLLSFVKRAGEGMVNLEKKQPSPDYQYHPLVHLEIDTAMRSSTSVTRAASPSATSPSFTRAASPSVTSPSVTAAGAVVGGIFAVCITLIVTTVIAIVAILLVRRRQSGTQGATNPIYEKKAAEFAGTDEPQYAELMEVYTQPSITSQEPKNSEIRHTATCNAPTFPPTDESQYSVVVSDTRDYAQPETSSKVDLVKNPCYSYTKPSHYEYAVYVPTKEQREGLSEESHMYATLEEVQMSKEQKTLTFFEDCDIYWRPSSTRDELYAQLAYRRYREIPSYQIKVTESLGSGQFGIVSRGVWQDGKRSVEVAVKTLKRGSSEEDTVRFLQEAAIMGQFRHPNIVELLGVVTVKNPVMIVAELVHNGDLRNYLLSTFSYDPGELPLSDTAELLSQFCLHVARGMDYLSSKAFVHRDLAARNILITDQKICKISDFGMSRDLEENSYYICQGGQIPVKWTAPEALQYKKYSTASDVWSFGCLMYEIWSLGHKPFEGCTNQQTVELIDAGQRLAPPPGCPLAMYKIMIKCWNNDKSARPEFREIVRTLSQPEHELLYIPEEEVSRGHPQASILGAPLEAGSNFYTELQNTYKH